MKPSPQSLPSLLALTRDDPFVSHAAQVESMITAGIGFIQLRSKALEGSSLVDEARRAVDYARRTDSVCIINDCPHAAAQAGAHGVHLGMKDFSPAGARALLGESAIIGRTVHSLPEAKQVMKEAVCDYVGVGPYRLSKTKSMLSPVLGHEEILEIRKILAPLPVFLIGGLGLDDFGLIDDLGIKGLAVCSALSGKAFGDNLKAFVSHSKLCAKTEELA